MKTPPWVVLGALLFWGWQAGAIVFAALMGIALESSRLVKARWEFTSKEYNRIWDLCGLLFLGAALYCFATRDSENLVVTLLNALNFDDRDEVVYTANVSLLFFQWWPMIFFPFAMAQAYGARDRHPVGTFFYFVRRKERLAGIEPKGGFNISYIYLAICLFGASASEHGQGGFYLGFAIMAGWALWHLRPHRFRWPVWGSLILAVSWFGYEGHKGLHRLQGHLESGVMQWVTRWMNREVDPNKSYTRIGRIGDMKLSGKILMRVKPLQGPVPGLIRDSAYSIFHRQHWNAGKDREFSSAFPEEDTTTWTLEAEQQRTNSIRISAYLNRGKGILTLPAGTWQLADLFVGELNRNRYGVVQIVQGPGLVQYQARFGAIATPGLASIVDDEGRVEDLGLPRDEQEVIDRVARLLRLDERKNEREKLAVIAQFFARDFEYSTYQEMGSADLPDGVTPLSYFLETSKKGHCEFYGTAATLLLRRAGIPARYANGYSVHEATDDDGGEFVVRERHGHAWAIYWSQDEQRWIDFDTTPASWREAEEEAHKPPFEAVSDFFNRIKFAVSSWWWGSRDGRFQQYLAGAVVLLVAFLFWRLLRGRGRKKGGGEVLAPAAVVAWPGMDSAFYEIEKRLETAGLMRYEGETFGEWLRRLQGGASGLDIAALGPILELHYRYRFDPKGVGSEGLLTLREKTETWLEKSERA